MTRRQHHLEAPAVWYILQWFPGTKVLEAPPGMREAVLKFAKKRRA